MKYFNISLLLAVFYSPIALSEETNFYEKAYSAYKAGNIDESYSFLKQSLSQNTRHLPSKLLLAEVLALSENYNAALDIFEESIAQGADLNLVIASYIRVLLTLQDYNAILRIPESKLTDLNKGFLRSAKAAAHTITEDYVVAAQYHEQAYEIAPKSIHVLNSSARFYLMRSNTRLAKVRLDESLLVSTNSANTYELLAKYYAMVNNTQERISALKNGLAISSSHPIILRELVSTYVAINDFSTAKAMIEKTIASSPNDPMARLLLSWVASHLGETELSNRTLTELVNQLSLLDTADLATQDYLLYVSAMANYAANNLEVTKGQLEQFLIRNPRNFQAAELLSNIFFSERSFIAAVNILERFEDEVNENMVIVARLCRIYIELSQNHKCDSLLTKNRVVHGQKSLFIQTESALLSARGKLSDALSKLSSLNSSDPTVLAQQVILAIDDNQLNIATEIADKLLQSNPNNHDYLNLRASILKKQGFYSDSENIYIRVLKNEPDHYAAGFNLTHVYFLTNRLSKARAYATSLLQMHGEKIDLLLLYANILMDLNETEDALIAIKKAERLGSGNKNTAKAFIRLYVQTRDFDSALFVVNGLLQNDLKNVQLLQHKASLLFELGRDQEAQKELRILFGLLSDDSQSLFVLSDIRAKYADVDGALETMMRADAINPGNVFANRNLAKLAILKKDKVLANERVSWLVANAPFNPDVFLLQADLAMLNGNEDKAATHYLNALKFSKSLAPALIGAYQLAQKGVRVDEFLSVFTEYAAEPEENVFLVHLLADFYYTNGNMEEAKNAYMSIAGSVDYEPLSIVFNNLANIYVTENKIDAAYNFAQQAYEKVQNEPSILDTLGWIMVLRGEYGKGLRLLRQAYSMNAQDPNLRYHLAFALHKLKRNAESLIELSELLEEFETFDKRNDALALKSIIQ